MFGTLSNICDEASLPKCLLLTVNYIAKKFHHRHLTRSASLKLYFPCQFILDIILNFDFCISAKTRFIGIQRDI